MRGGHGKARAQGPGTQGSVVGLGVQKPQAETKVLSPLPSGTEGFQPWEPCPWEQQPSCAERSASWTKNGSCSLNGKPGPHRSLPAAPHCSHDNSQ